MVLAKLGCCDAGGGHCLSSASAPVVLFADLPAAARALGLPAERDEATFGDVIRP
jgi:hypothetical protein